ncbi:MAG: FG-GAP-like repeat-containing protein, partial [Planctomycetaceae bacterium]|nr:FG-GAP-like repeat-containing protein [Planctomycetaceae bacterium]
MRLVRGVNRYLLTGIFVGIALGGLGGALLVARARSPVPPIAEIRRALFKQQLSAAVDLASQRLAVLPGDHDARLLLGEAWQRQQNFDNAVAAYAAVPQSAGEKALAARIATASLALRSGRLADAEAALLQAEELAPHNPLLDDQWVSVLTLTGQRWRSLPHLQRLISQPNATLSHAIFLANPDEMPAPPDDLFAKIFAVADPLGLLGSAFTAAALGREAQAHTLLDRCLAQRPDLIEAHIVRGNLYLDAGSFTQFAKLMPMLPSTVEEHPGYWMNCGRFAHLQADPRTAVRCYWETLKRQPNHDRATYQMGQALAAIGERNSAERFLTRGTKLSRLKKLSVEIFDGQMDEASLWEAIQLTEQLGRLLECRLWCNLLLERSPTHRDARLTLQRLEHSWADELPLLLPAQDLASHFDGARYPLPHWEHYETPPQESITDPAQIRFVDEAQATGLDFVYFSGEDLATPGKRMFEYTGGGVGILDYDLDGWPDAYLSQGSRQPGDLQQSQYLDQFFRNRFGATWQSIAEDARLVDPGFGQGVSVGDFDNDGFGDLYVANIDGNRLYRNNGDGTFADITREAGLGHEFWTTSCLLADINGDAVVDVFDVTFLEGDDVFDRTCQGSDGVARSCAPAGFPAAPDQVYLGNGDGAFRRLGPEAGFAVPDGDGLGIVAADFDHSGQLSLFVGNDGRANFYFIPQAST